MVYNLSCTSSSLNKWFLRISMIGLTLVVFVCVGSLNECAQVGEAYTCTLQLSPFPPFFLINYRI